MKKCLVIMVMLFLNTTLLSAQTVDDLTFITEHYPPLNFEQEDKLQGISVDVLTKMFGLLETKKTIDDIHLWPWARGYKKVQSDKNTVLFSMARTEAREELFKWVGPIIPSHVVVLAKKDKGIKLEKAEDMNRFRVGVVRDDIGEQLLLQMGVTKDHIHQTTSGINTAKMMQRNRVDMWAYEEIIAFWNLKIVGEKTSDYEIVYSLKKAQYYFAFQKDTDDQLIALLQEALDKLKADGSFDEIVKSYVQ